jgi:hypothetical protein
MFMTALTDNFIWNPLSMLFEIFPTLPAEPFSFSIEQFVIPGLQEYGANDDESKWGDDGQNRAHEDKGAGFRKGLRNRVGPVIVADHIDPAEDGCKLYETEQ